MVELTRDEHILKTWIGRTEECHDVPDAGQARLMQATLDQEPSFRDGDALPCLWHWIYFHGGVPLGKLGRDGHPGRGDFVPPVDLPRRMWAGGRFEFFRPLIIGSRLKKTSVIRDVALKHGRSGALCFVTIRHEITDTDGQMAMREEHDAVYREEPGPDAPKPEPQTPPAGADWSETITPSPVMLFRYSALTFNGHRIHYDRDYSRNVEGYPDLVFHGPLTGTLLANMAERENPDRTLARFSFRALSPLFDTAPFTIRGKPETGNTDTAQLWAETPDGHLAMTARAVFSDHESA